MDLLNIDQQLGLLNNLGYTIPVDEKMKLKLAHIRLMNDYSDLDEVKYWGKIQGLTKNYYIMLGLKYRGCYQFPHKTFYWASQDFEFKPMPDLLLQHRQISAKFNGYFSGDPNKILQNIQGQGEGQEQPPAQQNPDGQGQKKQIDQQEQQLKKVPKRNYTELHRLSHLVHAIQNDAHIIPQGSYKMTTQNQLTPNKYFYGLDKNSVNNLTNWHHFRAPQTDAGRKKIQADNVVFSNDFLDNLQADLPKGVWSIQVSSDDCCASCRNLTWPGYYAFHGLNTSNFGSLYIGDGIKNIDLAFML